MTEKEHNNRPRRTPTEEQVKLRLAGLCARSEQCTHDIATKLYRSGLPQEACRRIMATLHEGGFIDDSRFARNYARHKAVHCGWGRQKIRAGLMAKRIGEDDIAGAFDELDDDVFSAPLMKAARAKARTLDLSDYNDRMKLMRHLLSRGYSPEEARQATDTLREEENES